MKRLIAALILALSVMGCASASSRFSQRFIPVEIRNYSTDTITLWAHYEFGGQIKRINVTSLRTAKERIPFNPSRIIYFRVHPIGTSTYYNTPSVMPQAGQTIVVDIFWPPQFTTTWLRNS